MKFFLILLLFVLPTSQILSQISQGQVLINTFDPRVNGDNTQEFVVLVNNTATIIDLNGYEVQAFNPSGDETLFNQNWTVTKIMQPFSFLLIASIPSVYGIGRDEDASGINDDGYLALRKIGFTNASDYIDLVKFVRGDEVLFSGVPLYSDIDPASPSVVLDVEFPFVPPGQYATRGGVSGKLDSLKYTAYGVASDFTPVNESSWFVQNSGSSPLPVELSSFSAVVLFGKSVKFKWQTETELNNYGFEIERKVSSDQSSAGNYEKIGFVIGNGNSNSPKEYSFTDDKVTTGKYSYRLKQIDNDGEFEYSNIIEVNISGANKFDLSQNYPNPFNPTTTIRFSLPEAGQVKLAVFNVLGEEVSILVNENKEAGVYTINLNASELTSGLYIYKIETNTFFQIKKMVLLK